MFLVRILLYLCCHADTNGSAFQWVLDMLNNSVVGYNHESGNNRMQLCETAVLENNSGSPSYLSADNNDCTFFDYWRIADKSTSEVCGRDEDKIILGFCTYLDIS